MRPLTSINVQRSEKAWFDWWQSFQSFREGRALQQCEAFAILVDVARKSDDPRVPPSEDQR